MGYPYEESDANEADAQDKPAEKVAGNAGACPPIIVQYRIYRVEDFSALFGNPPPSVKT